MLLYLLGLGGSVCSQGLDSVWSRVYDFRQTPDDWYVLNDGVHTSDNSFVLIGCVQPVGPEGQLFIVKIGKDGDTAWSKTVGDELTHDVGVGIIEMSSSDLMAMSIVQFEGNWGRIRLHKMTPGGDVIWERTYLAETEYAYGYGIAETADSGTVVTGVSESDMFVLKTDSNGDSLWIRYFGGDFYDAGVAVAPTSDGGAIAVGYLSTADQKYDSLVVVRVDPLGDEVWGKVFPFSDGEVFDASADIYRDEGGEYILTATPDFGPVFSYKVDENGTVLWSSDLDQDGYLTVLDICEGRNESTYITGSRGPAPHTLVGKIDSDGDSLFLSSLVLSENSTGEFIHQDDSGYIYVGGRLLQSHTFYIAKLKEDTESDIAEDRAITAPIYALSQNYPNPFNPSTRIEFSLPASTHVNMDIFNILGQRVRTLVDEDRPAGVYAVVWDGIDQDGGQVASGLYFCRLIAGDFVQSKKMLLTR